jgi:transcriptional regulator with XRE-family HTH domain
MAAKKQKSPAPAGIDEQLKAAIRESGLTHYRIGKDSGVASPIIDRFMSGERDLRLATAAKLAETLGLELKPKLEPKPKSASSK